jgi:stage II sporulation protein E
VTLRENRGLVFETSISKEIKYGSEKTGDTAMSEEYGAKKAVMVLCDGMGSGEEAAKESLRAIDLTKRFVRAGFDLSLTLKVLNSALASGNGDMYTTLDVCSINLYTGQCEIIKNGGSTIFIYSCGEMRAIRSTSLPFGVVRDWEGEKTYVQIKSGDTVTMVTDGITEAFGIENEERAVALAVAQGGGNVDKISSLIVEAAKLADGGKAGDDMTVVVGRFI